MMRGIHSKQAEKLGRVMLVFAALLALASCWQRGATKAVAPVTPAAPKPAAPAPASLPSPPLSIPQTQVALPPPQPIDPAALATESVPQDAQQPATRPPYGPRRPPSSAPVTPSATPAVTPAATPPATAAEPPRNPIQEMIDPVEVKRLFDQAQGRRREVKQILDQLDKRGVPRNQQNTVTNIRNFVALSEEAERRNDMRQADALAERAQILARDLQNGK